MRRKVQNPKIDSKKSTDKDKMYSELSQNLHSSPEEGFLSNDHDEHNESHSRPHDNEHRKENLKKDYKNIALLMFLYMLQGLPLGLTGSLPYILSSRKVSYSDQATFSFAFWPFSMKLIWAPLVDSIFFKRFGRRKSWLIPVQYAIGIFMFVFSDYVNDLLETGKVGAGKPYGNYISIIFCF